MMQSTTHFRCQTSQCTTSNRQADQDQACVSACVRVRACVRVHVWKYRYRGGTKTAGHTHSRLISHLWVSKGAAASVTRYNSLVGHNNRLFCNHLLCPVWVDILFQANKPSILIVRLRVCLMWQCGRNKVNVVRLVGVLLFYKDIFILCGSGMNKRELKGCCHNSTMQYDVTAQSAPQNNLNKWYLPSFIDLFESLHSPVPTLTLHQPLQDENCKIQLIIKLDEAIPQKLRVIHPADGDMLHRQQEGGFWIRLTSSFLWVDMTVQPSKHGFSIINFF